MGVNDLNLLKSWNPNLLKNKQKIWKERELLKEEDLKIKELNKELSQTKEEQDDENASTKSKTKGLSWMYDDSASTKTLSSKNVESSFLSSQLNIKNQAEKQRKPVLSLKDKQKRLFKNENKVQKSTSKANSSGNLRYEDPLSRLNGSYQNKKKNKTKFSSQDPMSKF